MALIGIFKDIVMNKNNIKRIIKVPNLLMSSCINLFCRKAVDDSEEQKIEELAQKLIHISNLLDQRKYIPHGPAYSKLPDFHDLP